MPAKSGKAKSDAGKFQQNPAKQRQLATVKLVEDDLPKIEEVEPLFHTYNQTKPDGAYFDEAAAVHAIQFIQKLRHFKGRTFAGRPFILLDWQLRIITEVFGWKRPDGTRLYREVYIEAARKCGKTTLAAAVGLYLAFEDQEPGAEVYFAAYDKDQAGICYSTARIFAENLPELRDQSVFYNSTKQVLIPTNPGAVIKVLSKESSKQYGLNLHGLIFDELMTQKTREMWEALTTSTGSREQPLIFSISTAGWNRESVCYEQHQRVRNVHDGASSDPYFFGAIFTSQDDVPWDSEEAWKAGNPSLGSSVKLSVYQEACAKAKNNPPEQNSFITLLVNRWVGQQSRFLPMSDWDACTDEPAIESGAVVFGGLDLSATTDLSAFVVCSPGKPVKLRAWLFMPSDNLRERGLRDKAPYDVWVREGLITLTPGNVIDYDFIKAVILQAAEEYTLKEVVFDPYNATQFVLDLEKEGITTRPLRQGVQSISAPAKELLRLTMQHQIAHGGNPVLRWMADHCAVKADEKGNIQLDKHASTSRIDAIAASVMALDSVMRYDSKPKVSVYDRRLQEARELDAATNRAKD